MLRRRRCCVFRAAEALKFEQRRERDEGKREGRGESNERNDRLRDVRSEQIRSRLSISFGGVPSSPRCAVIGGERSREKRYRLNFTDPCNIRTASSPSPVCTLQSRVLLKSLSLSLPLSVRCINSGRHFYLSDKFSRVLGTSCPSRVRERERESGKESSREVCQGVGGGGKK